MKQKIDFFKLTLMDTFDLAIFMEVESKHQKLIIDLMAY